MQTKLAMAGKARRVFAAIAALAKANPNLSIKDL